MFCYSNYNKNTNLIWNLFDGDAQSSNGMGAGGYLRNAVDEREQVVSDNVRVPEVFHTTHARRNLTNRDARLYRHANEVSDHCFDFSLAVAPLVLFCCCSLSTKSMT